MISGTAGPGDQATSGSSFYVVSVLGGSVRKLPGGGEQAVMSPDDTRIAYSSSGESGSGIWMADADGGNPRPFIESKPGEWYFSPTWSPDGKRVVYRHGSLEDGLTLALESRGLDDATSVVLVREGMLKRNAVVQFHADDFLMLDGRLVFARDEPAPRSDSNLWEIPIDAASGAPRGEPKRLTDWVGLQIRGLSATADGSRLAFRNDRSQFDVWVGELRDEGRVLDGARRLTLDERDDSPACWTPDGRAVVFESWRYGNPDLFVQDVDQRDARDLVVGPGGQSGARMTPDGSSMLYWQMDVSDQGITGPLRLLRVPLEGGPTELVLKSGWPAIVRCATRAGGSCVLGELTKRPKGWSATLSWLDPVAGRGETLSRAAMEGGGASRSFALSPDGSRLAVALADRILIRQLESGRSSEISVEGLAGQPSGLAWAADGRGFYVSCPRASGGALLHVDLQGKVERLHETREWNGVRAPTPSPDGRYLAFAQATRESNVWLIESF